MMQLLQRTIHPSWLLASLAWGVLCGVGLSMYVAPGWFQSIAWFLVVVVATIYCFIARKYWCVGVLIGVGVLLGLYRGALGIVSDSYIAALYGKTVTVEGVVTDDTEAGRGSERVIRLAIQSVNNGEQRGQLWVTSSGDGVNDVKRGDAVVVTGELQEGFSSFIGTMYRAQMIEHRVTNSDIGRNTRDWFGDRVRSYIDEPEVSLGLGYLLGQRRDLPMQLDEALVIVGLTHVVVASGYNLTILVRFARRIGARISKFTALALSGGLVVGFIAITGMSPSMSRAGLVTGLSLLAWYYGRVIHPLVLLPVTAAVTVLVNPMYLWGDIGWWLSFAAFAGVIVLAPLLQAYFFGKRKPGVLRQVIGETVAAQIATLPIIVLIFAKISLVSVLANLLVLPLVPLAMLLVFLTGVFADIHSIASFFATCASLVLHYMVFVTDVLASVPWAQVEFVITNIQAWLFAGMLVVIVWLLVRKTGYKIARSNIVE